MKVIDHKDLNYQLGFYVGLRIIDRNLYSLETDLLKPNDHNIKTITDQEKAHYNSLDVNFEEQRKFCKSLKLKYLPKQIKVTTEKIWPNDLNLFREGIEAALWDSDSSNYSVDDLDKFFNPLSEEAWCCEIILKLDI